MLRSVGFPIGSVTPGRVTIHAYVYNHARITVQFFIVVQLKSRPDPRLHSSSSTDSCPSGILVPWAWSALSPCQLNSMIKPGWKCHFEFHVLYYDSSLRPSKVNSCDLLRKFAPARADEMNVNVNSTIGPLDILRLLHSKMHLAVRPHNLHLPLLGSCLHSSACSSPARNSPTSCPNCS